MPTPRLLADLFIARRPVLDETGRVAAYELSYRHDPSMSREEAAWSVLRALFNPAGEEAEIAVGARRLLVSTPPSAMMADVFADLDLGRMTLQIDAEDLDSDAADRLATLKDLGAAVCLHDDPFRPLRPDHAALADFVRIDTEAVPLDVAREMIDRHVAAGRAVFADNVMTHDVRRAWADAGATRFQGIFLSQPEALRDGVPGNRMATMQLLAELDREDFQVDDIEAAVSQSVSLSVKVLRYVNSAFVGLRHKVESIRQAVVLLGPATVRQIATVALLAEDDDVPLAATRQALIRAKFCDGLGRSRREPPGPYYTAGLFSAIEPIVQTPVADLLAELPLTDEVTEAVLDRTGRLGQAVRLAEAYERAEWDDPAFADEDPTTLSEIYFSALAWVEGSLSAMHGDA